MQLALCTGERRDRASQAWKVVGQIEERVALPKVRNWHGKGSCCGKLTQCCQKASWQCFERSHRFPLAATSLLHHDSSMLLSLDVHVVQKVMWAGIHSDWRACRTPSNNCEKGGRLMLRILNLIEIGSSKLDLQTLETLETVPGMLQQPCNWHFVQENAGIEPHGLGK